MLVFMLLLLLFPLALAVGIIAVVAMIVADLFVLEHLHRFEPLDLKRLALGGLVLALLAILFKGFEDQLQPRHHLIDRRQLAGRAGLAARAGGTLRPGLALWPCLTAWSCLAALALRPRLARRARLAQRSRLAARTVDPAPAGMTLRAGPARLAGLSARASGSLSSLPGGSIVRHARLLDLIRFGSFLADGQFAQQLLGLGFAGLININRRARASLGGTRDRCLRGETSPARRHIERYPPSAITIEPVT
jgi:hypothetical protein